MPCASPSGRPCAAGAPNPGGAPARNDDERSVRPPPRSSCGPAVCATSPGSPPRPTAVGVFASLVLLIAALFIATAEAASPDAPPTGTLLFKGGDASIPAPLRRDRRAHRRRRHRRAHTRHAALRQPRRRLARRRLRLPAAGERRPSTTCRCASASAASKGRSASARRRAQAYEQAKQEGRKAALVEQERPNLFTTSVAPIGPNEEVVVEIEYQQTLRYDSGAFSIRFPMAITPRYIPGTPTERAPSGDRLGAGHRSRSRRIADHAAGRPSRRGQGASGDARASSSTPAFRSSKLDEPLPRGEDRRERRRSLRGRRSTAPVPADRDFELDVDARRRPRARRGRVRRAEGRQDLRAGDADAERAATRRSRACRAR